MPIISVIDNENNRWKRSAKKATNKQTKPSGMEAKVKEWQLNDFVVGLSYVFSN